MDTKTFLQTILPSSGVKYVMRLQPRPNNPKGDASIHYVAPDAEEAAELILNLDRKYQDANIYFAMASYKEAQYKTTTNKSGDEFTYVVGRTQQNAKDVKCLWMDWDVGKDTPDSYGSRDDALAALKVYLRATGLPTPMIVSSGYGIHTYWLFTEEVDAQTWESVAKLQRVIMRHLGVRFDPSRDKDCASVLRPVGTYNKKVGKAPQLVKVVKAELNAMPAMEYKRVLTKYIADNKLGAQVKPDAPTWAGVQGNLSTLEESFPDSFAEIAVQHCKQLQEFSQTGGASEPLWYANLGVLKHCEDGEKLAHLWSSNHVDYDEDNTQAKLDQWNVGPTTCLRFKELNAKTCEGCKHTCKSPVQLGHTAEPELPNLRELAEQAVDVVAATEAADEDSTDDGLPIGWPAGFGYDKAGDRVTQKVQDANGVWQDIKIATPLFYPVEQFRDEDGTYAFRMHMWQRGQIREFSMPTAKVADPRSLRMHLFGQQIQVMNDKATASYLANFMVDMARKKAESDTYRQMGWKHDYKGWLIGDCLITEKEVRKVSLSKAFSAERRDLYAPKGTAAAWVDAVDELYNRENAEPYQFAICAAFAAPLHDLLGYSEWRGIPFALTTNESGYGKTTVNMIANSIWYDPEKGKISNSTAKAVLGVASEFNNLPFLLDEVTSYLKDPADMGDLLYAMSNGRGREGMTHGGGLRQNTPPWKGVCVMTGNRNILTQITENKLNPEAMQMRVFEIDLDTYARIATMEKGSEDYRILNSAHSTMAKTLVNENSGVIGTDYVRFIMKNIDAVRELLRSTSKKLEKHMDGDATKERFYYHLITTVLVGGLLAKKMGFLNFDMNKLQAWCIAHVKRLRGVVEENSRTPEDHFASLMSAMANHLLVTVHYSTLDSRKHQAESHVGLPLRNPICGRYVIGDEKERPQLYVTVASVQQWCIENGASFNALRRDFIQAGLIRFGHKDTNRQTGAIRMSISKGVAGMPYLGKPWCLELDAERASGLLLPRTSAEVLPMESVA